ncbi:flagellin [Arcobacter sp. CECT 8985]|uniref:flagellin n=1 Tax=Arcobacter sp. CECT 8985 TaxID=1935424 RepID=UPI00100A3927|nr:flagellin [Arcobacter sp. CECT 8985]RXJ83256.1 flagellin [Arcobacter sp. CECT 8985]
MRINTNAASLIAQEAATNTTKNVSSSLEKLSTGLRINKASDDASGLAIADKLRTQANSIGQSISNGNSAVSLTQIADKAMSEQSNILDTIKTKLVQAATDTTSDQGREAIGKDISKLLDQLNNIATQTNYNGTTLLQNGTGVNGDSALSLTFQMGETSADTIKTTSGVAANVNGLDLSSLKASAAGGFATAGASAARGFMSDVDDAINTLNGWRADFGSTQNQLESAIRNQMTQQTNIKSAESVIRDVDYAQESANFNKQNIISQAGTYAMSQANSIQQNVLRLLQ